MIPPNRLSRLLHQVKDQWISECAYHNTAEPLSLLTNHTCERDGLPSKVIQTMTDHTDEVWIVRYSKSGRWLATAGKDESIIIYDSTKDYQKLLTTAKQGAGVCYLAWSPDETTLVACIRQPQHCVRVFSIPVCHVEQGLDDWSGANFVTRREI
jgi:WD40 repeat protein